MYRQKHREGAAGGQALAAAVRSSVEKLMHFPPCVRITPKLSYFGRRKVWPGDAWGEWPRWGRDDGLQ